MSVVKYIDIDRHMGIGGSDSHALMGTNVNPILDLWELKTQRKPGADLSNVLPVQMGTLS